MTISALPPAPARTDPPSVFVPKADAFVAGLQPFADQANDLSDDVNAKQISAANSAASTTNNAAEALASKNAAAASAASAILAPGSNGTSTTSLTIASGNISLTTQTGKSFVVGSWVNITRTSDVSKSMLGQIVSYNSGTGALVVSVAAANTQGFGSGPYTDWSISQSSMPGNVITAVEVSNIGSSIRPSLICDFANSKRLDSRFVYTMSSKLTYFDAVGNMKEAEPGVPAFDHDPITGKCKGWSVWESRTNYIRNNIATGGTVGTPGVVPTNWQIGVPTGCTREIIVLGAWKGQEFIQLRVSGTVTGAAGQLFYVFAESNAANGIAATGQTWTHSAYLQINAGSLTNTNFQIGIDEMTSGGSFLAGSATAFTPVFGDLNANRISSTRTLNQATTGALRSSIYTAISVGATVDFTITIALPQLEQGAFATPVIKTSGVANNRAAPTLTMATSAFDFNAQEGTMYFEGIYGQIAVNNPTMSRIDDGTENNRIMLRIASAVQRMGVVVSGTETGDIVMAAPTPGIVTRVAGAYKVNDLAATKDGSAVSVDTNSAIPSVTTLRLGSDGSSFNYINGYISKFAYYPKRLSNNELVSLSTL